MKRILLIATIALITLAPAYAQENVTVDVTKLNAQQLQVYQQLKAMQNTSAINIDNLTPEKIDRYAQIGKAFGSAFKECWTTVSTDAEKFAQSDAGKWAMVLVSWKIMGNDAVNLVEKSVQYMTGIPLLFIGTFVFVYIIRRNCFTRPCLVSSTKVGPFTVKREYKGTTSPIWGGEETLVTAICYAAFLGICCLIIFVG